MSSALFHAVVSVMFLAVYAAAGEILVGVRRRQRTRLFRTDGPDTLGLGWHCGETRGPAVTPPA